MAPVKPVLGRTMSRTLLRMGAALALIAGVPALALANPGASHAAVHAAEAPSAGGSAAHVAPGSSAAAGQWFAPAAPIPSSSAIVMHNVTGASSAVASPATSGSITYPPYPRGPASSASASSRPGGPPGFPFGGSVPGGSPLVARDAPTVSHLTALSMGRKVVHRQEEHARRFIPTAGYPDLDALAAATAALGPTRARAVELLKKADGFEFAMAAKESIRDSIAAKGFLNQHDTLTSAGTLNPSLRASSEASFMGMSREDYDKLPNTVRPKYGFMRPKKGSGVTMKEQPTGQYGSDTFIFKQAALEKYLTFYPNNSLGNAAMGAQPTGWQHALHPWSERMLLAPTMQVSDDGILDYTREGPAGFVDTSNRYGQHRYYEIQVWRPLAIRDVERFEFQTTPPSGAFLKALRDHHVKIFQKDVPTEWRGDAPPPHTARRTRKLTSKEVG